MRFNSLGFTLIELLATISIIAILATVGVVSYVSVLKSSRDHQRKRDLQTIAQALEIYRNDQRNYPLTSAFPSVGSPLTSPDGSRTYLSQIPADPNGNLPYSYKAVPASPACDNSASTCNSYCLFVSLENPPSPTPAPGDCVSYPPGSGSYNYNYYVGSQ